METAQNAPPEQDDQARHDFEEEARLHNEALSALRAGDADRIAQEFNRHLDRVQEILLNYARRCIPALAVSSFFAVI
jgi:DNA-binding GntR family transcriptional regulator